MCRPRRSFRRGLIRLRSRHRPLPRTQPMPEPRLPLFCHEWSVMSETVPSFLIFRMWLMIILASSNITQNWGPPLRSTGVNSYMASDRRLRQHVGTWLGLLNWPHHNEGAVSHRPHHIVFMRSTLDIRNRKEERRVVLQSKLTLCLSRRQGIFLVLSEHRRRPQSPEVLKLL